MSATPESNVGLAPPPETRPPKVRTKPGASLFERPSYAGPRWTASSSSTRVCRPATR